MQWATYLDSPDLGEFIHREFTAQEFDNSLYSFTVLRLVYVTWNGTQRQHLLREAANVIFWCIITFSLHFLREASTKPGIQKRSLNRISAKCLDKRWFGWAALTLQRYWQNRVLHQPVQQFVCVNGIFNRFRHRALLDKLGHLVEKNQNTQRSVHKLQAMLLFFFFSNFNHDTALEWDRPSKHG